MSLTLNEIRAKFLHYMKERGHAVVPSASLVPENDPTTLFTGSGMQPMLPYLLGQPHPLGKRIADSQKSFRSQDIEEVGDNRHTTFFEMLGNWSFGDYFKEEEITWMWTFLIDELKLDPQNFYVTCFSGNDELGVPRDTYSAELWQKLFAERGIDANISDTPEEGIDEGERIFYYSEKKNWWSRSGMPQNMPEGEPGGPDSEMFYDFDPTGEKGIHESSLFDIDPCHVNCDCGRFFEIGNNVFMQYKKTANGFEELPQMNVDHGSGLERYAAALRNDPDMFNIDVFDEPKKIIYTLSGIPYISDEYKLKEGDIILEPGQTTPELEERKKNRKTTYAYRVILDHIRSAMFLIGDDVLPGNKDQMYFVRRLIRRAVRFARNLGVNENFTKEVASSFIETYKEEYTNLQEKREIILNELDKEEGKFRKTLENGLKEFEKIFQKTVIENPVRSETGREVYPAKEYTLGEPNNKVVEKISGENAFNLLQSFGFPVELTEELAKERGLQVDRVSFDELKKAHSEESRTASAGKFKGGLGGDGEMEVKYHTATHMLHQALREVLGETVEQKGSNITPERLRFDFSFERKMTDEEKKQVEDIMNERIRQALPVIREEVSMDEARARGAIGLFGDKYGDVVSIYRIGEGTKRGDANLFSMEFCGGPHVNSTGDLAIGGIHALGSNPGANSDSSGPFKIIKEEAVSAGVRRIKATLS